MQHHELIEGKAIAASNRARFRPADGQAVSAQIENGDLVAEPVHLDDKPICERVHGQIFINCACGGRPTRHVNCSPMISKNFGRG